MIMGDDVETKNQSLVGHLTELRIRVVQCGYILIIATGICYGFSEKIFDFIRGPIAPYLPNGGLIYTGPLDKFMAHIKISFVCGIIISCPLWFYQIWKFIAPGLYAKERKYAVGITTAASILFLLGSSFAYFIVLPMAFKFLMHYGGDIDKPMISIDQYLGFFNQMCLMFGVAFEMPLVLIVMGMFGVVSHAFLKEKRRYAIMVLAVISAVITPPDLLSMVMMLIPMVLLYEIAVVFVGIFERKRIAAAQNNIE